jgi:hypothetical protein
MQDGICTTHQKHVYRVHSYSIEGRDVDMNRVRCGCGGHLRGDGGLCSHLYAVCVKHPGYRLATSMLAYVRSQWRRQQSPKFDEVCAGVFNAFFGHLKQCLSANTSALQSVYGACKALTTAVLTDIEPSKGSNASSHANEGSDDDESARGRRALGLSREVVTVSAVNDAAHSVRSVQSAGK